MTPAPRFFVLAVLALVGWLPLTGLTASAAASPNVILILTDDQGLHDVGCYGSEIPTPHIDSLARDGLKFSQFYAASAICTPSRYGLLTGRNPSRSRDRLLSALMFLADEDRSRGIHPGETTVAEVLRDHGYDTVLIGKWHLGHGREEFRADRHGFNHTYGHTAGCIDYFTLAYGNTPDWYRDGKPVEEAGYATDLITDEAVGYLGSRKPERPFFLFLPYNAPHFGKGWDDGNDQPVNILQPHPRDLGRVRFIKDPTRRKYAAMVVALDDAIGRLLAAVDGLGLSRNTLIVFMSDHGGDPNYGGDNRPLRAGKATLFEGGIRVPCLVRWPGRVRPGTETSAPTWAMDWFPPLCALAGVRIDPQTVDGVDLAPLWQGKEFPDNRTLFWELGAHAELDRGDWIALRQGPWKYVGTPDGAEELFQLESDPTEQHDLAGEEKERWQRLRQQAWNLAREYHGVSGKATVLP